MAIQKLTNGGRQTAASHLQCGSVWNQIDDVTRDSWIEVLGRSQWKFFEKNVILHNCGNIGDVDLGRPMDTGHKPIHFQNDVLTFLREQERIITVCPKAEVTILVHRGDRRHKCMDGYVLSDHPIGLIEVVGHVVNDSFASLGAAAGCQFALCGSKEHAMWFELPKMLETKDGITEGLAGDGIV